MEKTFRELCEPEGIKLIRNVVPHGVGIRVIYNTPEGRFVGEVLLVTVGEQGLRAVGEDLANFIPEFIEQQKRPPMMPIGLKGAA